MNGNIDRESKVMRNVVEFREPRNSESVEGGSLPQDRRPEPSGASCEEEARHEEETPGSLLPLSLRPGAPRQADAEAAPREAAPAPGFQGIPASGHGEDSGDHPAERWSADADGAPRKRGRGRPPKRWRIHVVRIDASQYPQFLRDRDHPFMAMSVSDRNHEIDSFLARLRARARKGRAEGQGHDRLAA